MKVTILTPNISVNCLGRAYVLARVLQNEHEVEIVGPMMQEGIWSPLAGNPDVPIVPVDIGNPPALRKLPRVLDAISGSIMVASKPLLTSFGLGMLERRLRRKPLVLDVDDWEPGLLQGNMKQKSPLEKVLFIGGSALKPHLLNSYWNIRIFNRLSRFADAVTVSNSFLEQHFGGTIIYHARSATDFSAPPDTDIRFRHQCGFAPGEQVVMFLGTPQPYKGLEKLVDAMSRIERSSTCLCIVGLSDDPYSRSISRKATETLGPRFRPFGVQPFSMVPGFLSIADVVVIPQEKADTTLGQTPAKVFDAMAMARPVIATRVGDLPWILEGCGWIVPPGDPASLARIISEALNNPVRAAELGRAARARFEKHFCFEAMEPVMSGVIQGVLERAGSLPGKG